MAAGFSTPVLHTLKPKANLFSSNMFMVLIFALNSLIHLDYFDDGIHP